MMNEVCKALIILILILVANQQIRISYELRDSVSSIATGEADAIRSAESYAKFGFQKYCGLPDITYGNKFPEKDAGTGYQYIYTHYPPGPNYIVGMITKLVGTGKILFYRLFSIGVGLFSLLFLTLRLKKHFGYPTTAVLLLLLLAPPMTLNMMHALHYQGHAFSLLLVELALLLPLMEKPSLTKNSLIALFLLGFVQGWLSFDYFFLVSFAAAPFILYRASADRQRSLSVFAPFVVPMAGFAIAHLLHFAQVACYLGGFSEAVLDFSSAAAHRGGSLDTQRGGITGLIFVIFKYFSILMKDQRYFAFDLIPVTIALAIIVGKRVFWEQQINNWKFAFKPNPRSRRSLVASIIVAAGWIFAMKNHANGHAHFIPRHFFIVYFFTVLVFVRSWSLETRINGRKDN
jgi:hypothetical protein